jgi:hypothetical protein
MSSFQYIAKTALMPSKTAAHEWPSVYGQEYMERV